jgi:hypothetical protein
MSPRWLCRCLGLTAAASTPSCRSSPAFATSASVHRQASKMPSKRLLGWAGSLCRRAGFSRRAAVARHILLNTAASAQSPAVVRPSVSSKEGRRCRQAQRRPNSRERCAGSLEPAFGVGGGITRVVPVFTLFVCVTSGDTLQGGLTTGEKSAITRAVRSGTHEFKFLRGCRCRHAPPQAFQHKPRLCRAACRAALNCKLAPLQRSTRRSETQLRLTLRLGVLLAFYVRYLAVSGQHPGHDPALN